MSRQTALAVRLTFRGQETPEDVEWAQELIDQGTDLVNAQSFERAPIYQACRSHYTQSGALVVIAGLRQNLEQRQPPFTPPLRDMFQLIGPSARERIVQNMQAVHEEVCRRLNAPPAQQSETEQYVATRLETNHYWRKPFVKPDLANLPCPGPALKQVVKALIEAHDPRTHEDRERIHELRKRKAALQSSPPSYPC